MEMRCIGRSDLAIAPLMLGGNVFGWSADRETSFAILDAFVDAGFNGVDTADIYSGWVPGHVGGESETIIGEWLATRGGRDKVIIATKVGADVNDFSKGTLTADRIERSAEGSLRRLRTDYIDLYQAHIDDVGTTLDETLEAFERLVKAGKARAIGASHYSSGRLREALQTGSGSVRYQCYQPSYNLYDREEFESEHKKLCLDEGLGVVCYSALAKGFLTGKYRVDEAVSASQWGKSLREYQTDRGQRILEALDEIADARSLRPAEIALAWLIAQPAVTAAIVAVNKPQEFEELQGAMDVRLHPDELSKLALASSY